MNARDLPGATPRLSVAIDRGIVCLLLAALLLVPLAGQAADSDIDTRLKSLERKLDSSGLLELVRQLDQLQQEVRRLRGELENQAHALEQLRAGQRDLYTNLDSRLVAVEQGAASAQNQAAGYPASPTGEPPLPTLPATGGGSIAGQPAEQSMALAVEGNVVYQPPAGAQGPATANGTSTPPGAIVANVTPQPPAADGNASAASDAMPGQVIGNGVQAPVDTALAGQVAPPATPAPGNPSAASAFASPGADSPESEAAYRDAFAMLKAGQYEDSIAAFNTFLQQYPNSQYADNAQYWLGEAYYVMRQFEPAIEQYQKLVQNYPASQKQSHALLKIAYSYSELGLNDQALATLNELKARFPGSAAARLADERIQRIRAQAP